MWRNGAYMAGRLPGRRDWLNSAVACPAAPGLGAFGCADALMPPRVWSWEGVRANEPCPAKREGEAAEAARGEAAAAAVVTCCSSKLTVANGALRETELGPWAPKCALPTRDGTGGDWEGRRTLTPGGTSDLPVLSGGGRAAAACGVVAEDPSDVGGQQAAGLTPPLRGVVARGGRLSAATPCQAGLGLW